MKKINISISEDLLLRADRFSENNNLSRSGLISLSLNQYLGSQEAFALIRGINLALNKIAENGDIDEETLSQLEDFGRICNMIVGK